jgi:carbamoyl-phosphate synthase large subunit
MSASAICTTAAFEGIRHRDLPALTVQYHPEGSPGPQDRAEVFDEFLEMAAAGSPSSTVTAQPVTNVEGCAAPRPIEFVEAPSRPRSVLVIGSGPVVIGQAAEFDYAGTQACRSLREEGVRVILVNSNPATIMTDAGSADAVYIEPLTVEVIERIIERERPEALLATLGGQTALNLAVALDEAGVLDRYGVRSLGTSLGAIKTAEDRERFKDLLNRIGEPAPESKTVVSLMEAREFVARIGLPVVVRPAFTLGGTGGGLCDTEEQLAGIVTSGLALSPIGQVLVERSLAGWRELEYEVMRDGAGTCITVCNMENIDPMGVHTGDSIVVAPSQTLTDREHQQLRSAALRIIRALEICGGCNVQFAMAPDSHEYYVIEVNPRVSRSSALASKATGYPIARVAAKIALGMRLDEITNSVTGKTTAAFEPALDYCVVKIPRWPFDKFPAADRRLGTQMKSTGEVMAIERTFEAAFSKAVRSLEQPEGHDIDLGDPVLLHVPNDRRAPAVLHAFRSGTSVDEVRIATGIGRWFLDGLARIVSIEGRLKAGPLDEVVLREAKRSGMSDRRIADLAATSAAEVLSLREGFGVTQTYKSVDTCAAQFAATTPYYYSTFELENEQPPPAGDAIAVVGSGPIRIGQGIEFDYCSVQAATTLQDLGREAIMINSNPETVSTDFDCSTRLYFEPLDEESVAAVIESERAVGALVQFGGQTAVNLADPLERRGVVVLGTDVAGIEAAEDRKSFEKLIRELGVAQAPGAAAHDEDEAARIAEEVGYPVLVRPSFVLGGGRCRSCKAQSNCEASCATRWRHCLRDGGVAGGRY